MNRCSICESWLRNWSLANVIWLNGFGSIQNDTYTVKYMWKFNVSYILSLLNHQKKLFFKFDLYLYIGQNHDFAWESDNIIEKKNNRILFQGFSLLKRFAMNHTNVVHYLNILHGKSARCALHPIAFHALLQKRALERIFPPQFRHYYSRVFNAFELFLKASFRLIIFWHFQLNL